jgi:hypothetical protein
LKGSFACGVQGFNCLRRSKVQLPAAFKVQLPAAFKGSIACGVPASFLAVTVQLPAAFKGSIACGVQGLNCLRRSRVQGFKSFGIWVLGLGIWDL